METLKQVLMRRDGLTESEAHEAITAAQEELDELLAEGLEYEALQICETHFGLEPDFLDDVMYHKP